MAKKKKKKLRPGESYTRENRPPGVSKREWDEARRKEGLDPRAKFFEDPAKRRQAQLSQKEKEEAERFVEEYQRQQVRQPDAIQQPQQPQSPFQIQPQATPFQVQQPQMSMALTPEEQEQADRFTNELKNVQERISQLDPDVSWEDAAMQLREQGVNVERGSVADMVLNRTFQPKGFDRYTQALEKEEEAEQDKGLLQRFKEFGREKIVPAMERFEKATGREKLEKIKGVRGKVAEFLTEPTEEAKQADIETEKKLDEVKKRFEAGELTEEEYAKEFKKVGLPLRGAAETAVSFAEIGGIKNIFRQGIKKAIKATTKKQAGEALIELGLKKTEQNISRVVKAKNAQTIEDLIKISQKNETIANRLTNKREEIMDFVGEGKMDLEDSLDADFIVERLKGEKPSSEDLQAGEEFLKKLEDLKVARKKEAAKQVELDKIGIAKREAETLKKEKAVSEVKEFIEGKPKAIESDIAKAKAEGKSFDEFVNYLPVGGRGRQYGKGEAFHFVENKKTLSELSDVELKEIGFEKGLPSEIILYRGSPDKNLVPGDFLSTVRNMAGQYGGGNLRKYKLKPTEITATPGNSKTIFLYKGDIDKTKSQLKQLWDKSKTPTEFIKPKERGFIRTVKEAKKTPEAIKKGVSSEYDRITNPETLKQARTTIAEDFEGAVARAKKETALTTKIQAESLELIEELQAKGRYDDAIDIIEKMSERATEGGQATQILAAYNRLTPEGVVKFASDTIRKARKASPSKYGNLKLSSKDANRLRRMAKKLEGLTGDERIDATREMLDEISRLVPTPTARKITTLWKAGLLTGIKGAVGGNTVGNTTMAGLKKLSDAPSATIDTAISTFTGKRAKAFTMRGMLGGFGEGIQEGLKNLKKGVGAQELATKLDYKKAFFSKTKLGKAAQEYTDFVFNFYSAADRPFYHSALKNNLYELAEVEAKNKGLVGDAAEKFIDDLVKSPTDEILTKAHDEALNNVFQNKNLVGQGLSGLKKGIKTGDTAVGEIASEGLLPFTGVPSSIATAVHNYSPTGAVAGVWKAINSAKNGGFTQAAQRELADALGKSITGTGLIWLGMKLTNSGQMTLGYPKDAGERSLWEKEGKQPYSIKINGKWRSLNYTGPIMSLLTLGGAIKEEGLAKGILTGVGAILGSSPLQGVQGWMDAVTDPQRYGDSYVKNQSSSIIPTIVKDIAVALDATDREKNTITEAIQAKIPGLRNMLLPKRDITGEEIERKTGPAGAIIDPFKSSKAKTDSMTSELRRLQDAGFGPTLAKLSEDVYVNGKKIELSPEELDTYERVSGTLVKTLLPEMMELDYYKGLDDEGKKDMINDVINSIRKSARAELFGGEAPNLEAQETIKGRANYEKIQSLYDAGKEKEADALVEKMSNKEYAAYTSAKTSAKRRKTEATQEKYKSQVDQLVKLYSTGEYKGEDAILNTIPDEDLPAVMSKVKSQLKYYD